ncbi:MAG: NYN domain-containing protein [Defluviicoccus sp.]|nr:NYN domain-containing protein [Defluviicoccus sp.]
MGCDDTGAPLPAGRARLAVLIDAENASPRFARAVFEAAGRLGEATVRRIYGDFSNGRLASWNAAFRTWSIVPCHQPAHVRGKNAADIALAIDAIDLSYRARLDGFVLVSSDSDFTRLAQRLREGGFAVYGFGESKTPRAFRSACHRFEIVGTAASGASGARRS